MNKASPYFCTDSPFLSLAMTAWQSPKYCESNSLQIFDALTN
jgi:hypothetical protein